MAEILSKALLAELQEELDLRLAGLENIPKPIAPETTFTQWCEQLGREGLKVDGHPLRLDDRPAMRWVYDQIPSTPEEANKKRLIIQKAAQVGFTVFEILALLYMGLKFGNISIGFYLPDRTLASIKSQERFMPIVRTVPVAYDKILASSGRAGGEGNVLIRNMGEARYYFMHISGTLTESVPLDVVSFDEVQEMSVADMEKTSERMSASSIRYTLMGSTANWEEADINFWYLTGTQHQFWTDCPRCGGKQVLDEHFPDCIKFNDVEQLYMYVCNECEGWITDPQQGEWLAKFPDARDQSLHFPQTLSVTITPGEIIRSYFTATDMKNFFNRKLGKPYTDPTQVPMNMAVLNAAVDEGRKLGVQWKHNGRNTFAGIDQMGSFSTMIVGERLETGHLAIIHVEEIYTDDPFARSSEIMEQYGVVVCVLEQLPNLNDARRFAKKHEGKVFLINYKDMTDNFVEWNDDPLNKADRKTADEERMKYTVSVDQFRAMSEAFGKIKHKQVVFPDPDGLVQEVNDKGVKSLQPMLRRVFKHFMSTALITVKDEEQHKYRRKVVKVGIDPHHSYSFMMLVVAFCRAFGTTTFILPQGEYEVPDTAKKFPGLPHELAREIDADRSLVCGNCIFFNDLRKFCEHQQLLVKDTDPACSNFYDK
jgi:hypothetical protein